MASSSPDGFLKGHFERASAAGSSASGSAVDRIAEWLRSVDAFKRLDITEEDFRKSLQRLKVKALVTFDDFQRALGELAKKNGNELEQLKMDLVALLEEFDRAESRFREGLKKGEASVDETMEWLRRNRVMERAKIAEAEVKKTLDKVVAKANTMDRETFVKGMKELAAKNDVDLDKLMKSLFDPGFLPKTEEDEKRKKN